MREKVFVTEKEHYEERVNHYQEELKKCEETLEFKKVSLEILKEVNQELEFSTAKSILEEDINLCLNEIRELNSRISNARGNLNSFKKIVEGFNNLS